MRTTKYEISVLASGRGSVARVASKASDRDGATTAADKPSKAPAWQMNYARIKRGKHHVDLMWISCGSCRLGSMVSLFSKT